MAPAFASPPPCDRSQSGQRGKRSGDEQNSQGEGEGKESTGKCGEGKDSEGKAHEVYGPLDIERCVKNDGRALILYVRREHEDG